MLVDNSFSCVEKLFRKLNLKNTKHIGFPIDGLGQIKILKKKGSSNEEDNKKKTQFSQ